MDTIQGVVQKRIDSRVVSVIAYDVDFHSFFHGKDLRTATIPSMVYYHQASNVAILVIPAQESINGKVIVSRNKNLSGMVEHYSYRPDFSLDGLPKLPEEDELFRIINWRSLRGKSVRKIPQEILDIAREEVVLRARSKKAFIKYGDLSDFPG